MNNLINFEEIYKIYMSLNDNNLVINIINIETSKSYVNNIDIRDLKSPFDKEYTYYILLKCFKRELNHQVIISKLNYDIKLNFNINIQPIYELNFEIILINKETDKIKSVQDIEHMMNLYNDLSKIIEKHTLEIYNLKSIIDCFGSLEVKLYKTSTRSMMVTYTVNTPEIILLNAMDSELLKIKMFYCLEKFTVELNGNSIIFENRNLKHLTINGGKITSLKGLSNLPLLETLEIINCHKLNDIIEHLNNNIYLKKIYFIKSNEKQKITLNAYCLQKKIELILE
jgi:hypothetical protein